MKYYKCKTSFDLDTIDKINEFAINSDIKTFSSAVRRLVDYGLEYLVLGSSLIDINNNIKRTNNKLNYINTLIKQLYSDLELEYHTNIKMNSELKKIDSNIYRNNYDK